MNMRKKKKQKRAPATGFNPSALEWKLKAVRSQLLTVLASKWGSIGTPQSHPQNYMLRTRKTPSGVQAKNKYDTQNIRT